MKALNGLREIVFAGKASVRPFPKRERDQIRHSSETDRDRVGVFLKFFLSYSNFLQGMK
ncbi:MAG: hypothetical protein DVB23_000267 [Verrucomicrobia bacterium]|nr:MAG: hypothetical protein DVB23_000267 [Verrucomicrobiota bacterium]